MQLPADKVLVEVVELDDHGNRQIGPTERITDQLINREAEVKAAIVMAARIVTTSAAGEIADAGWHVSELEAKFGITLSAEAGVIVGKASAEATFEVTLKVTKG
jgi:hypothetical protein